MYCKYQYLVQYTTHRRSTDSLKGFSWSLLTAWNSKPRARGMGTAGNRIYSTIRTTFSPSTMVVLVTTNESPYPPRSRTSSVPSGSGCWVKILRCALALNSPPSVKDSALFAVEQYHNHTRMPITHPSILYAQHLKKQLQYRITASAPEVYIYICRTNTTVQQLYSNSACMW